MDNCPALARAIASCSTVREVSEAMKRHAEACLLCAIKQLEEAFAELANAIHQSNTLLDWQEPRTSLELLGKKKAA